MRAARRRRGRSAWALVSAAPVHGGRVWVQYYGASNSAPDADSVSDAVASGTPGRRTGQVWAPLGFLHRGGAPAVTQRPTVLAAGPARPVPGDRRAGDGAWHHLGPVRSLCLDKTGPRDKGSVTPGQQ